MTLDPGTRLGPYEVTGAIGAGGMGEVYKARDTRLDRTVAIKVLPQVLALDPQFRERFEREAKSISSLNHPNICTLHDVGNHEGTEYLVMEFIDGESLASRLTHGPLPLTDAMKIAVEIAGALDKAHRQGIVHRDLKPGNVMLTKTGSKLLDFGLAKMGPAVVSGVATTVLATPRPTGEAPLTARGTILGTFQYMSPEQIEGEATDARSDIFAFGAVVYEMLTGRKAFSGKSQASLLGSILKDEPPAVSQVQPLAPPALDYLVRTCLAKDPEARFQTAHDLLLQLRWIAEGGSAAGLPAPTIAHRRGRERLAWTAAAVLGIALLAAGTAAVTLYRESPSVVEPILFTISPPENTLFAGVSPQFSVSPDGRYLAFAASAQNANVLWIRPLGAVAGHSMPGTEAATFPFWSADSRFIGFFAQGKLKKVAVSGGPAVVLCDAPNGRGGTWNSDNLIVFAPNQAGPLHSVAAAGGSSVPVTEPEPDRQTHRWPSFLPDGRHYLFLAAVAGATGGEVRLGSLDSKEAPVVVVADSRAAYASGHVLFVRGGNLMALPFDEKARQSTGDPFQIAEQVGVDFVSNASFSASLTGVLMHARGGARPIARLTWFDRLGKRLGTVGEPGEYFNLSLSRDERRVAVSLQSGTPANRDLWLLDLTPGGAFSRFTFDPAQDGSPIWSFDGARVAFGSSRTGPWNLYMKAVGGGGEEELLLKAESSHYVTDWSRDGRFLAYSSTSSVTGLDLWVLPLSDKKPQMFLQTTYNEDSPMFSPDGRWIAYDSNESGRSEIYVRPYPGPGGPAMVSRNGGAHPQWRDDGRELFFLAADGTLFSSVIDATKDFHSGVPSAMFPTGAVFTGNRRQYAVTKDGKRFLVNVPEQRTTPSPITVVLNWIPALPK